jgi:hypothetical protein
LKECCAEKPSSHYKRTLASLSLSLSLFFQAAVAFGGADPTAGAYGHHPSLNNHPPPSYHHGHYYGGHRGDAHARSGRQALYPPSSRGGGGSSGLLRGSQQTYSSIQDVGTDEDDSDQDRF